MANLLSWWRRKKAHDIVLLEQDRAFGAQSSASDRAPRQGLWAVGIVLLIALVISAAALAGFVAGVVGGAAAPSIVRALQSRVPQLGEWLPQAVQNRNNPLPATVSPEDVERMVGEDAVLVNVVERAAPAVVSIIISKDVPTYDPFSRRGNNPFGPFFGIPFGDPEQEPQTERQQIGGGSGFFISQDGLVVTNRHVVSDQNAEYTVVTSDGTTYDARVLARDPVQDIAVIKVEGSGFPVLPLGDSDAIRVGQTAIAIGNSLAEFSNSVSRGIISGLQRNIVAGSGAGQEEQLFNIIQTDAAINPGNSGGPLLDISGAVIGVNTAVASGAENVGFALPINQVKRAIDQVQRTGTITRPILGVRYVMITPDLKSQTSLTTDHGALILRGERPTDFAVIPGSPADKAGLVENDVITEVDGQRIDEKLPLAVALSKYAVGDTVRLTVLHRNESKTITVTLEEQK